MSCPYSDESHGAADGYWCTQFGHVEDPDFCGSDRGYEQCPYMGQQDILTEALCSEILAAVSSSVQDASYELNSLFGFLWGKVSETNYEALYQAVCNALHDFPNCSGYVGGFASNIQYSVEAEPAAELDAGLENYVSVLNIDSSDYGTAPYGGEMQVSDYDLDSILGMVGYYYGSICGSLEGCTVGSSSRYASEVESQLREIGYAMESALNSLMSEISAVREQFARGMEAISAARNDEGRTLRDVRVEWKFF